MKKSILSATAVALALVCTGVALAAVHVIKVTPKNFNAIFNRTDVRPDSDYKFVVGPPAPPLGKGSLELITRDSNGKQQHLETQQQGIPIADVSSMSYWTYKHATTGSPVQVASINMEITSPTVPYATLVFEPVYNTPQGPLVTGQWQHWDAYFGGNAIWWSTRVLPGAPMVCAFDCFVTWNTIVAANPGAKIISYGINQGTGNPNIDSNVDALHIDTAANSWTYNFEPCGKGKGHGKDKGCKAKKDKKPKKH